MIDKKERSKIKFISMDMYENYKNIIHTYFLIALCCTDSFHAIKKISDEPDKIRCKVMNRYKNDKNSNKYYLLKYKHDLLFINSLKISDNHFKYNKHSKYKVSKSYLLEKMLNINNKLKYAYELKELYSIYHHLM